MHQSAHDLSRRVKTIAINSFSFREYINIKRNIDLPKLSITDILDGKYHKYLEHEDLFNEYLQGCNLPFHLDTTDWQTAAQNLIEKVIHQDIPNVNDLKTNEINSIKKTTKPLRSKSYRRDEPYFYIKKTFPVLVTRQNNF